MKLIVCVARSLPLALVLSGLGACADEHGARGDEASPNQAPDAAAPSTISEVDTRDAGSWSASTSDASVADAHMPEASTSDARASDTPAAFVCPAGPMSPLGSRCGAEGSSCAYGYDPPECGGRTVVCRAGSWQELSHSDPRGNCAGVLVPPPSSTGFRDGDPCRYESEAGSATIVAIEDVLHDDSCEASVQKEVKFAFTPADATGKSGMGKIIIAGGRNPPASCLAAEGLVVGAVMPVTQKTQTAGNCSPISFDFARSFSTCVAACEP